ncbi:MAG TPA: leucyl/phenylalanyl-tRNA--protein transferase [Candidatus Polarisedimenticolia bacterium]|nr:leucyl/phenylalanyl-tRNA--protein transferase [Candidatus Polarisedimenticolia bacterium]
MDAAFPFPEPHPEDEAGLVAFNVPLTAANLLASYRRGIFPWPHRPEDPVPWLSPDPRAILEFDCLHIPGSLAKARRKCGWSFTIDRDFPAVIAACATVPRPGQEGTWILPGMRRAYTALHASGSAHSVEVWDGDTLVGGLYGVDPGGVFVGESMFRLSTNASKLALLHLVDHLAARGATWIDIQQLTPHMEALGAREIPRDQYFDRLAAALAARLALFGTEASS